VFFQDAGVYDYEEAGAASAFGGFVVRNAFLHPDGAGADADGRLNDVRHEFRPAENIHDVYLFGNVFQARVAFLTQHVSFARIYWNDAVADRLQVIGDAVTGAKFAIGEADDRNRPARL